MKAGHGWAWLVHVGTPLLGAERTIDSIWWDRLHTSTAWLCSFSQAPVWECLSCSRWNEESGDPSSVEVFVSALFRHFRNAWRCVESADEVIDFSGVWWALERMIIEEVAVSFCWLWFILSPEVNMQFIDVKLVQNYSCILQTCVTMTSIT